MEIDGLKLPSSSMEGIFYIQNVRSDNAVKNYFYFRVRHEMKRINDGLQADPRFKSIFFP